MNPSTRISPAVALRYQQPGGTLRGLGYPSDALVYPVTDVPFFYWAPPTLVSMDDRETPDAETFGTRATLVFLTLPPGPARDTQRLLLKEQKAAFAERQRRTLLEAPFIVNAHGIFIMNLVGDQQRAFNDAMDTALRVWDPPSPPGLTRAQHVIMVFDHFAKLYTTNMRVLNLVQRTPGPYENLGLTPSASRMAANLLDKILQENPDARLNSVYVLEPLPDAELVRYLFGDVFARLRVWFTELARAPNEEAAPWIALTSRARLLQIYEASRFFLFEVIPGVGDDLTVGVHAYAHILSGAASNGDPAITPVGIGMRARHPFSLLENMRPVSALLLTVLHELGHVLDAGEARRSTGRTLAELDQPGRHDAVFYRAFQYNVNLAVRCGVLDLSGDMECWDMDMVWCTARLRVAEARNSIWVHTETVRREQARRLVAEKRTRRSVPEEEEAEATKRRRAAKDEKPLDTLYLT
jgi:hypothetical protein